MLRPYKFHLTAVCQQMDGDGAVVGEQVVSGQDGQPLVVFGVAALREFAETFEEQLRSTERNDGAVEVAEAPSERRRRIGTWPR